MKKELDLTTLMNQDYFDKRDKKLALEKEAGNSSPEVIINPYQENVELNFDDMFSFKDVIPEELDSLLAIKTVLNQNYGEDSLKIYQTEEGIKLEFNPSGKNALPEHLAMITEMNNYGLPFDLCGLESGDDEALDAENFSGDFNIEPSTPNDKVNSNTNRNNNAFENLVDKAADRILISLDRGLSKLKQKLSK